MVLLGSQGIVTVVKCKAAIFFRTVDFKRDWREEKLILITNNGYSLIIY